MRYVEVEQIGGWIWNMDGRAEGCRERSECGGVVVHLRRGTQQEMRVCFSVWAELQVHWDAAPKEHPPVSVYVQLFHCLIPVSM